MYKLEFIVYTVPQLSDFKTLHSRHNTKVRKAAGKFVNGTNNFFSLRTH